MKKMYPLKYRFSFLVFSMFFSLIDAKAEGTKEAMPDSANGTGLYLSTSLLCGNYLGCPVDQRIKFRIKDHNIENLYFALQARDRSNATTPPLVTNMYYKIFSPTGTLVAGPTLIASATGSAGYIQHYS